MGIGCRRDPMEANVLYVSAADQGDERAIRRIAAIQAAAEGADPHDIAETALARQKDKKLQEQRSTYSFLPIEAINYFMLTYIAGLNRKSKRFGVF